MTRSEQPENREPTYDEVEACLGKRKHPRKTKRRMEDAPTRKSWNIKPFTLIVSSAVGFLVLFGGLAYFLSGPRITTDPEEVLMIQREIFHIDLPPNFRPASAFRMSYWGQKVKMAIFPVSKSSLDHYLMIIEYAGKEITENQLGELFSGMTSHSHSKHRFENEETIQIPVEGQERSFMVSTVINQEDDGTESQSRMVSGVVFSHSGYASVFLMVPEDEYDETAAIRLMESIHR